MASLKKKKSRNKMFLRRVIQEPGAGALPGGKREPQHRGSAGNGETVTRLVCLEARTRSPRGLRKSSFIIWFEDSKHLRCAGNDLFTGALTGLEASLRLMDGARPCTSRC